RHFPQLASKAAWWDLERVFGDADLLSAPTGRAVDLLADSTGLPRAEVISCGIDLSRYADLSPASAPTGPTFLFVGRLEQEKNLDELLRAFALVPAAARARLEVVGMGSLRARLEALADELGIASAVTFAGAVSEDDLLAAYGRADVFVMPGTAELQSLATLEAMAAGRPVVAADAMALPHLVRDGENGYLYPPGDAAALAARLTGLATDPGRRREFGAASRRIAERHSLSATVDAFEDCYGRILAAQFADTEVGAGLSRAW
ncbi:MAG: glycosyltransferase, partial [Umezawaea sp.]